MVHRKHRMSSGGPVYEATCLHKTATTLLPLSYKTAAPHNHCVTPQYCNHSQHCSNHSHSVVQHCSNHSHSVVQLCSNHSHCAVVPHSNHPHCLIIIEQSSKAHILNMWVKSRCPAAAAFCNKLLYQHLICSFKIARKQHKP